MAKTWQQSHIFYCKPNAIHMTYRKIINDVSHIEPNHFTVCEQTSRDSFQIFQAPQKLPKKNENLWPTIVFVRIDHLRMGHYPINVDGIVLLHSQRGSRRRFTIGGPLSYTSGILCSSWCCLQPECIQLLDCCLYLCANIGRVWTTVLR